MSTRKCRAQDPATCRYHGKSNAGGAVQTMAVALHDQTELPPRIVKTGTAIGKMFRFANSLKGSYRREKHLRPRNIQGDAFTWTKPGGGLWLSTLNDENVSSWEELWGGTQGKGYVERPVTFKPEARVLVIDSLADYRAILDRYPHYPTVPAAAAAYAKQTGDLLGGGMSTVNPDGTPKRAMDFEAIAKEYDAIVLSQRGLYSCGRQDFRGHMGGDISLYLWDIESAFVLNRDAITVG